MKEVIFKILKTKTISHSLITLVGTVINGVLGAVFFIVVARKLGPENFGLLSVAIATLTLIADIADFGINTGLINFISKNINTDKNQAYQVMKIGLVAKGIIWLAVLLIGFLSVSTIAKDIFVKPNLEMPLRLAIVGVGGALLFAFVTNTLQALQRFVNWGILNISMNFLRLLIILVLLYLGGLDLQNSLIVYILIPFVGFLLGLLFLPVNFLNVKVETKVRQNFFKYNRWVALSIVISAISSRADTFFSARFLTLNNVGIYSVAVQLSSTVPQLIFAIATVVAPKLASFNSPKTAFIYLKKLQLLVAGLALLGIMMLPISIVAIPFFYGQKFAASINPFIILFMAQLIFLLSLPAHQAIFYYFVRPNIFVFFSFLQLVLIIGLALMLIPLYGVNGAALSVLIASLFNYLLPTAWVIRQFRSKEL